jgi:ferric-dicitrate binding protein FerR (iron transport regulator)
MHQRSELRLPIVALLVAGGPLVGIGVLLALPDFPIVRTALLADGSEAYFSRSSRIVPARDYPATRQIFVDGEVLLRVPAGHSPMTVRSSLMVLKIAGEATLAVQDEVGGIGAQAEVLRGEARAERAYKSKDREVYNLPGGRVLLLYRPIDLIEVEKTADVDVPKWARGWVRSVGPP